jgi:hypothetical protein
VQFYHVDQEFYPATVVEPYSTALHICINRLGGGGGVRLGTGTGCGMLSYPLMMRFNLCLLFQNYIARFGHGSAKLARQAQSKEKTLAKVSWALTVLTIFCCWASERQLCLACHKTILTIFVVGRHKGSL